MHYWELAVVTWRFLYHYTLDSMLAGLGIWLFGPLHFSVGWVMIGIRFRRIKGVYAMLLFLLRFGVEVAI